LESSFRTVYDMHETGERTARLLLDTIAGRRRPVTALAKTADAYQRRMRAHYRRSVAAGVEEARRMELPGEVLHASLFPVQPWIDVPDVGFATFVCADGGTDAKECAANKLADMTYARSHAFIPDLTPLEDAIRVGLSSDGLTVIADGGNAPTGGAGADSLAVLRALLAARADMAVRLSYLTLCDPPSVGRDVGRSRRHGLAQCRPRPVGARRAARRHHRRRATRGDRSARSSIVSPQPNAPTTSPTPDMLHPKDFGQHGVLLRMGPAGPQPSGRRPAGALDNYDLRRRLALKRHGLADGSRPPHQWGGLPSLWRADSAPEFKEGDIVVMDNLGSRKGGATRRAIEAARAKLLYLPPLQSRLQPD
jgi:hypothetical protein